MDEIQLVTVITQYGVIPGLFVWLLLYVLKDKNQQNERGEKREEWLKTHLEEVQEVNRETVGTLKLMQVEIKNDLNNMKDGIGELKQLVTERGVK